MTAEMTAEAREARREYQRQWRAANPDKVKKINATYWAKKAEQNRQKAAERGEGQ